MMILGLGVDVVEVRRIRAIMARNREAFCRHVFSPEEQCGAPENAEAAVVYYAGRWSAKEAVAKSLGTGIGPCCQWKDIEIRRCASGRPAVQLSGRAAETAASAGIAHVHVTISHERELACAAAVAEGTAGKQQPATESRGQPPEQGQDQ